MAQFASDAFTGTEGDLLSTYSANWTLHTSYTGTAEIVSSRVRQTSTTATAYYHSGTPATADYSVSADLWMKDINGGDGAVGVIGRVDTAANTLYMVRYNGGTTDGWQLYKVITGTLTQLGSTSAQTLADETAYNVKLEMIGTAIKLYKELSGTATISTTDSAITAAGKAGIRAVTQSLAPSDTTGIHLDNFSADDVASSGVGSSAGIGAATGMGASVAASVGASDGVSTVTGVGASTVNSVGSAAGVGTASGVAASTASSVGSSDGIATVTGIAPAEAGTGVGSSSGTATVTGVGASTVSVVGTASGAATVTGISGNGHIVVAEEINYAPQKKSRAPNFAPRLEPKKAKTKPKVKAKTEPKPSINRLRVVNDLIPPDSMLMLMQKRNQAIEQQEINRLYLYNIRARAALLAA